MVVVVVVKVFEERLVEKSVLGKSVLGKSMPEKSMLEKIKGRYFALRCNKHYYGSQKAS